MLAALGDHLGDPFGGHRDDREVHGSVDVAHGAEGGNAVELLLPLRQRPVDGVEAAGEAGVADVAEDAASDAAGRAAGADDGDRAGGEEPLHRAGLRALLARVLHGQGAVGGFEVELQAHHAVLEASLLGVPGVGEHLDHLGVGGQHLGGEPADAALPGDRGDVLQEGGGDAPALVGVLHEERDLGLVGLLAGRGPPARADAVVAHGADEVVADGRREPDAVHEVVVGEAVHVLGRQPRVGREEAVVLRLVGHLLVEADQPLRVVRGDGTDARGAAVAQHHVGLPVGGVLVAVRRGLHGPQSTARVRRRREAVCGDDRRAEAAARGSSGRPGRRSGHAPRYGRLV